MLRKSNFKTQWIQGVQVKSGIAAFFLPLKRIRQRYTSLFLDGKSTAPMINFSHSSTLISEMYSINLIGKGITKGNIATCHVATSFFYKGASSGRFSQMHKRGLFPVGVNGGFQARLFRLQILPPRA